MALQDKYRQLITTAQQAGVHNLQVREMDNVLYIDGEAPSATVKDQLWDIYGRLDPDYRSGDLILNINTTVTSGTKARVTTKESNLNIRRGPGTDQPIVGKAAKGELVTVINQSNNQWWLVRTDQGEEGYAHAQYLSPEG
ncbi:MAG: SH3 domain-containing protein [Flavisolibacter sp.]|nr:SH3 domain-containing protein [Flavisolibacter sp.]MBD0296476.1 SH3 domain-containing protein [Flavisolibacter sp.]